MENKKEPRISGNNWKDLQRILSNEKDFIEEQNKVSAEEAKRPRFWSLLIPLSKQFNFTFVGSVSHSGEPPKNKYEGDLEMQEFKSNEFISMLAKDPSVSSPHFSINYQDRIAKIHVSFFENGIVPFDSPQLVIRNGRVKMKIA